MVSKKCCLVLALFLVVGCSLTAQDRCFQAISIGNGNTAGSNFGAGSGGSDSVGSCGATGSDVWYSYVAPCNGNVTASFCVGGGSATYDTTLTAWDGSCGCGNLAEIACNDDYCGLQSQITFTAAAGQLYFIEVGGFLGSQGTFVLNMSCPAGRPTNDDCFAAIYVPLGTKIVGSNVGATNSAQLGSCGIFTKDVWYYFYANVNGPCTVSTCNPITNFDSEVAVWTGACGSLTQVACNDDNCGIGTGLTSGTTFIATAGTLYYVSVGGYNLANGKFALKISQAGDLAFKFFDSGPGTIGYTVNDSGGYYYMFVTLSAGAFPSAWFFGIDMSINDITTQIAAGYPFNGSQTLCGVNGAFGPVPSGLTVYAVALGVPAAGGYPTAVSVPVSFTTP